MDKEELESFAASVIDRFRNPYIKHLLMSISLNSMSKFRSRVLPQIISYNEKYGKLPDRLVFSLAALIRFYKGSRDGIETELKDDEYILDLYKELWEKNGENYEKIVESILKLEKLWGRDLNEINGLLKKTSGYLETIDIKGMKAALEETGF